MRPPQIPQGEWDMVTKHYLVLSCRRLFPRSFIFHASSMRSVQSLHEELSRQWQAFRQRKRRPWSRHIQDVVYIFCLQVSGSHLGRVWGSGVWRKQDGLFSHRASTNAALHQHLRHLDVPGLYVHCALHNFGWVSGNLLRVKVKWSCKEALLLSQLQNIAIHEHNDVKQAKDLKNREALWGTLCSGLSFAIN